MRAYRFSDTRCSKTRHPDNEDICYQKGPLYRYMFGLVKFYGYGQS